jgi:hypothetical protein
MALERQPKGEVNAGSYVASVAVAPDVANSGTGRIVSPSRRLASLL